MSQGRIGNGQPQSQRAAQCRQKMVMSTDNPTKTKTEMVLLPISNLKTDLTTEQALLYLQPVAGQCSSAGGSCPTFRSIAQASP